MNPRDLRIGNYVHTDTIFNGMIESISAYGKVYCWGRDENWQPTDTLDSYGHHRISPVPITEEWLKRFGFEKDNNFTWLTVEMNIQQRVDGFYIWLGSDLKIEHVHQLQNLYFALTGEELTPKQ